MKHRPVPQKAPAFFRRRDVWILLAPAACGVLLLLTLRARPPGPLALVSIGAGEGQRQMTVPLGRDDDIYIEDAACPVHLQVRGGAVRFVNAACPDHVCEGFGWISREGEWALCAPAGVMVRIGEGPA